MRISGLIILALFVYETAIAQGPLSMPMVSTKPKSGFPLSAGGKSAPLCIGSEAFPGVQRVLRHLQADIAAVTNAKPKIFTDSIPSAPEIVIVGTIGRSRLIDSLIRSKKIDVRQIAGKWEASLIRAVDNPFPGVARALVIAGSDKRGTIYGMYELSSQIGVSPWYWWADVPPKKATNLFILPAPRLLNSPKVKYRGIFINDENPALLGWVTEKFGGFNARFYEHVYELILRLKGNFLWPAMWGKALYDDDPENPRLADEYGVVIGTSHHEPMMRAHDEWKRYGKGGAWNYATNDSSLRGFWREGIRRSKSYESIVTLAMRGDGDEPMTQDANIALLQRIVTDQRKILGEVTGRDVTTIPQVWALYKEVQEYHDRGMRVPDDVTILLCDDNWGNLRKLPKLSDPPHKGGYGIYYHFDYVGAPRNYKWLNTVQIERVWEQMRQAYAQEARQIWIVNVGDIKPMEFPISFFMDYAWDPEKISASDLPGYYKKWAGQQFGPKYASEIADILGKYTKFNSRRKPELLDSSTYSLTNFREGERVVAEYTALAGSAQRLYDAIAPGYKDAFYQLVLHPVIASANVNDLYVTVGSNHLYATQGRSVTNSLARRARELYAKDSAITWFYNNVMAKGKWSHMMDQTHIGYTYWQQPERNAMPRVDEIVIPDKAEMGLVIQGSDEWWPGSSFDDILPVLDPANPHRYFEIFNRGNTPFQYSVKPSVNWIRIKSPQGKVTTQRLVEVSVDWNKAPKGTHRIPMTITGPGKEDVTITATVRNPESLPPFRVRSYVERDRSLSVEAAHADRVVTSPSVKWLHIPNLGRTSSAMTPDPVTAAAQTPGGSSPRLEYDLYLTSVGEVRILCYLSPVLNLYGGEGLRYAVSLDDDPPVVVPISKADTVPDWKYPQWWNESVGNNIRIVTTNYVNRTIGHHVLKFWMVDPGVVLQKIVVTAGEEKPSYLGPPESPRMQSINEGNSQ